MNTDSSDFIIRRARMNDRNHLLAMQANSMRRLARHCYSREEVEAFISFVGTMDDQLIEEGTYYVVEVGERPVASAAGAASAPTSAPISRRTRRPPRSAASSCIPTGPATASGGC